MDSKFPKSEKKSVTSKKKKNICLMGDSYIYIYSYWIPTGMGDIFIFHNSCITNMNETSATHHPQLHFKEKVYETLNQIFVSPFLAQVLHQKSQPPLES